MAKIAFLSYYSGSIDRGVETFVYELSKRLIKKHEINIYQAGKIIQNPLIRTYTIKSPQSAPIEASNLLSKLYLDKNSLFIFLFTVLCLFKIIKNNYDVIFPMNGGWQVAIVRIVAKLSKSKVIICGQAGIGSHETWNLFWRPDVFVALTTSQKVWAQRIAPENRVELIPNGVDLARFNPHQKPAQLNLSKPLVICAAALTPYKRVDLTIKAVAKAGYSLLVLGDGQQKGYIDALGKRLLQKKYLRINAKYTEIQQYYRAGNLFTLASKTEAFGISYLEAMGCNLPVVATKDTSRAEIIGNAGILTDPENINDYANAIQLVAKKNYRNLPYDQALKYSWNKIANKYSHVISELA